jgi:hypothetical protein
MAIRAIVTVAARCTGAGFGATRNDTDPLPLPEVGPVNVTHDGWPVASQEHTPGEETEMVPPPPVLATLKCTGETAYRQDGSVRLLMFVQPTATAAST